MTRAVNLRNETYDVYVGRDMPGKPGQGWGNPFRVGPGDVTKEQRIGAYIRWLARQDHLLRRIDELRGLRLGCWCKPLPCHGDVLAELAEMEYADRLRWADAVIASE